MTDNKKQNFLQGALILSAATLVVKIIGALYKIPLGNVIGEQGMANFGTAYVIYSTLFVIATAGLPVAISKMVSEAETRGCPNESRRILRVALTTFMAISAAGTAFMFFGARRLAVFMSNPDAYAAIMAISPAVFFVGYMSAFRGYHQGQSNMIPSAVSQVFEAGGKLIIGLGLSYYVYTTTGNLIWSAAAAIGGVSFGTVLGAIYMTVTGGKRLRYLPQSDAVATRKPGAIFKELMRISIPITISASVLTLTNFIDDKLIMQRLQEAAGYTLEGAQVLKGAYSYAQNLFNLPSAFILTLAVSVIPAIASAMKRGDRLTAQKTIGTATSVTALLTLPAAAGLMALSKPILLMLYPARREGALTAAPLLFTLGIAVTFVCLVPLTNSMLQALGHTGIPLISMSVGAVVKITCNYILVGNPEINISGAPVGTVACYSVIAAINLFAIFVIAKPPRLFACFFKPLTAAAAMGISVHWIQVALAGIMGNSLSTICAIAIGGTLYIVLILAMKALSYDDVLLLPKGETIARKLKIIEKM